MISLVNAPVNGRTGMRTLKAKFAYLMMVRRAAARSARNGKAIGFDANRFRSQLADYRKSVELAVSDQSDPTEGSLSGRPL